MRSILFGGADFSDVCTAQVVEETVLRAEATTRKAEGRPGAILAALRMEPKVFRVRLTLDPGYRGDPSLLRHEVAGRLAAGQGGTLVLPDEPGLEWRDVVCTDAGEWSSRRGVAWCLAEFTAYDPVAWGASCAEPGTDFVVGGNWRTAPVVTCSCAGGNASVAYRDRVLQVEDDLVVGDVLVLDCMRQRASVNGEDRTAKVTMASDFFDLEPGDCSLQLSGISGVTCEFRERWA